MRPSRNVDATERASERGRRARAEERGGRGGETRARARGSSPRARGQRAVARRERAGRGRETAAGERSRRAGRRWTDVDARACVESHRGRRPVGDRSGGGPGAERGVFEGEHQTARAHPPGGRPGADGARGDGRVAPAPLARTARPRESVRGSRAGRRPRLRRRGRARVARPSRARLLRRAAVMLGPARRCVATARGGAGFASAADVKRRMRAHVVRGYRGVRDPADTHAL